MVSMICMEHLRISSWSAIGNQRVGRPSTKLLVEPTCVFSVDLLESMIKVKTIEENTKKGLQS